MQNHQSTEASHNYSLQWQRQWTKRQGLPSETPSCVSLASEACVQPTWSLCSFRACRILATVALCWSLCSSWFMMTNRLLREISQTRNTREAACCCWHAHVLSWTIPSPTPHSQHILGGVWSNPSCTIFYKSSFATIILYTLIKWEINNMSNTWCNYVLCYNFKASFSQMKYNIFQWHCSKT